MYVHVHKSAGTTMCRWAEKMHERLPFPHLFCGSVYFSDFWPAADFPTSPAPQRVGLTCEERARSLHGATWNSIEHELCEHDLCFEDFAYVTVLRETVSRIRSQVNFEGPSQVEEVMDCIETNAEGACPDPPWNQPLRVRGWMFLDNFLVRTFGGCNATNAGPGTVTRAHLAAALDALRRFDAVIPLQNLSSVRAQQQMDSVLGWHVAPKSRFVPAQRPSYNITFSPATVARLERINSLDIELTSHFFKEWESGAAEDVTAPRAPRRRTPGSTGPRGSARS